MTLDLSGQDLHSQQWIVSTVVVSAVVVSNCYQLAWISAISRSRKWSLQSIYVLICLLLWNLWRCLILVDRISFDETLMRGYSRRLDFLELNPLVDLRRITKLTIHPTLLKKKNSSSSERNWPNNWTRTFTGGAVVIPVIMEIYTDFLVLLQTTDMTLTRLNQILREWFILQGKTLIKTNKQTKTDGPCPFYLALTQTRNKRIL